MLVDPQRIASEAVPTDNGSGARREHASVTLNRREHSPGQYFGDDPLSLPGMARFWLLFGAAVTARAGAQPPCARGKRERMRFGKVNCSQRLCCPTIYEREYDDLAPGDFEADEPCCDDSAHDPYEFNDFHPYDYVDDRGEPDYAPPAASDSRRKRIPSSLDATDPVRPLGPESPDPPSAASAGPPRESLVRRIHRWLVATRQSRPRASADHS